MARQTGTFFKSVMGLVASSLIASPGMTQACEVVPTIPIYDATGYVFLGAIKVCGENIYDITTGPNAPKPGQVIAIDPVRVISSRVGLIRAYPNVSYPIHMAAPQAEDGFERSFGKDRPSYTWSDLPRVLPFVPADAIGYNQDGVGTMYAYSRLIPLPGLERFVSPLNSKSIILNVSAAMFPHPSGLQELLGVTRSAYVEVIYYQQDEASPVLRRALIPTFTSASARAAWKQIIAAHPLTVRDPHLESEYVGLLGLGVLIGAMVAFNNSSAGQAYEARRQECLKSATLWQIC